MEKGDPRPPSTRPAPDIYPSSEAGATPLWEQVLKPLLLAGEPIPFETYMELCLYHEVHGYYSDPGRKRIGAAADFATSVSVGEVFGRLLAQRLHGLWQSHNAPSEFAVLELGPEDGTLALDLLRAARELEPRFRDAVRYVACEPTPRKREALEDRFQESREPNLAVIPTPDGQQFPVGVVLANEVLDALPVHLLHFVHGSWHERGLTLQDDKPAWVDLPLRDEALLAPLRAAGATFPEGYQTEVCARLPTFFREVAACLEQGLFLFIDYGFARDDYYHPDRTTGTLRTYEDHEAGDDPLYRPGARDLTAHVDFTAVAEAARRAGLCPLGFARQESYLTNLAAPLMHDPPPWFCAPSALRQFRTLTHPGFFGSRFHVLELTKGPLPPELRFPCRPDRLADLAP